MSTRHDTGTTGSRSNTLAAIFATDKAAREAIKELHKGGFKKTWLGKTRDNDRDTGEPTVEGADPLTRFLSAGDRRPLHRVLIERGLAEEQARAVEADIAPGCIVVTVYGEDDPQRAADLLERADGDVIDAAGATPRAVERAATRASSQHGRDDDAARGSTSSDVRWADDLDDSRALQRDRDRDRASVDTADTTNPRHLPTHRGDIPPEDDFGDIEGYEIDEFIATGPRSAR